MVIQPTITFAVDMEKYGFFNSCFNFIILPAYIPIRIIFPNGFYIFSVITKFLIRIPGFTFIHIPIRINP